MNGLSERGAPAIKQLTFFISLLTGLYTANATGQQAPDAGQLLQQQPKPPAVAPAEPVIIQPAVPVEKPSTQGPRVLVKGFRIKGAVLISEAELAAQMEFVIGKELTLDELRVAVTRLTAYYAQKGYLARVVLPPQDIRDGIVEIQVIEGKRGSLMLDTEGERIDVARIQGFIDQRLPLGAPMSLERLGESLNILNEQPGITVKADLKPGVGEGETDLGVNVSEKPLVNYGGTANNHGAYGTGEAQVSGFITLNNPMGYFDAASLLLNKSEGSNYARADYSLAVGNSGLRLGGNASYMAYELVPSEFSALKSEGTASVVGIVASYPVAHRTDFNLSVSASFDSMRLKDRTVVGETGDRLVNVYTLGLNGYSLGSFFGDGMASFGLSYVAGDSDQRNATALAADSTTRRMQGNFDKLGYNAGWLASLTGGWNINATLRGQLAGSNLDSSQQMSLGGHNGVRAYPTGEASGDSGWVFNLDLSRPFGDKLTGHLFYDVGGITLNHTLWTNWNASNPARKNTYTLSGVGVGVDWRINAASLLTASIATPLEDTNPGADSNSLNVDGDDNRTHAWIALSVRF